MASFAVVVPVKRLTVAKTRLAVAPAARRDLALAMALDTVSAALSAESVGGVVVVTDDDEARQAMAALGAVVVADVPDAGLNAALEHGAVVAAAAFTACAIAAIGSDLPALRPQDLDEALDLAGKHERAFVADREDGTVLLTCTSPPLQAHFGPGSRQAHAASGAQDITSELSAGSRLRVDVDTLEDLQHALSLGVGPHTAVAIGARRAG